MRLLSVECGHDPSTHGDERASTRRSRRPGHEVRLSNPDKVFFPEAGHTKLDLANYYLEVADAAAGPPARAADDAEAVRRRGRRRVLLPEAGAEGRAGVASDGHRALPERAQRARAVRQRRRPPGLGGEPRGDRLQPLAGAPRRPRPPRRAARGPGPDAGGDVGRRRARWRWSSARCSPSTDLTGFPKTSGSRGIHVNVRVEPEQDFTEVRRAALALAREVERRVPKLGDQQVVEGGAPRRLRRLQPERPRPHRGLRLLRAPVAGRARLLPARVGRGARRRSGRAAARHGAGTARGGRRPVGRDRPSTPARSKACSSWPRATRPEGLGDAPGRRTSASSAASRSGCSRAGPRRGEG